MSANSFRLFRSSLPDSFHQRLVGVVDGMEESTPHELVPGLEIVSDPAVRAEVEKFLGHGARPDVCRHIHWNYGTKDDERHQDLYDEQPWPVSPQYVMLFYYPQDTPPELGPTAVEDYDGTEHLMAGPAGTCFIMRHDAWHRATANRTLLTNSPQKRVMIRNLFRSM